MRKELVMTLAAICLTAVVAAAQVAAGPPSPPPSFSQLGMIVYPAQAEASNQAAVDQFTKAGSMCLQGRGYSGGWTALSPAYAEIFARKGSG